MNFQPLSSGIFGTDVDSNSVQYLWYNTEKRAASQPTLNDSPQPHCSAIDTCQHTILDHDGSEVGDSLMLGFRKIKRALSLSSSQSISLPMILNSALLSINTFTPSCSTVSSNAPGLSTYSRWYARPLQPRFFTPTRIILCSGELKRLCN